MSVGVVIVAAGQGARLGGTTPKQFLHVGGQTMLQRTVACFDRHAEIDEIVVVLPADLVAEGSSRVGPTARGCRVVAGGARRQDSVRQGLGALSPAVDVVLVHDGARPFVDDGLISRVIQGVRTTGAVVPAIPARDTVKRLPPGTSVVRETIAREEIWLAQTPQGFSRAIIEETAGLSADHEMATDDGSLAERLGHPVTVVPGSERNVKITTMDDLIAARAAVAVPPRVGTGYDLHRLVPGRALVLAGITIPFERGPLGHSDGDVVCHALVDAMLGAAGAGDIGGHFPNNDPAWAGAAGLDLLERARTIVAERGWTVASADVTVVLERPRLAPHIEGIRRALAGTLLVDVDAVSVKGKTNEGVDAVGQGEAIASHAVAVLSRTRS
jgi:2-C-methyl-D-erythritol 4-phosphate cytidylyltransferase/2-C-methyl-D-erythritol 2,4-cyclodiphosphate synthase